MAPDWIKPFRFCPHPACGHLLPSGEKALLQIIMHVVCGGLITTHFFPGSHRNRSHGRMPQVLGCEVGLKFKLVDTDLVGLRIPRYVGTQFGFRIVLGGQLAVGDTDSIKALLHADGNGRAS